MNYYVLCNLLSLVSTCFMITNLILLIIKKEICGKYSERFLFSMLIAMVFNTISYVLWFIS